jgi:hypothetical protein
MAVGLGAQAPQNQKSDNGSSMLTGCLAPLAQSDNAIGTTGTTASNPSENSASSEKFALFNPTMGPATSSSNGAVTPSADEKVLLQGSDLKKYQGHTVEIRGTWVDDHAQASGSTTASTADQHHARTFRVEAVTNVGAACSISGR